MPPPMIAARFTIAPKAEYGKRELELSEESLLEANRLFQESAGRLSRGTVRVIVGEKDRRR